MNDDVIGVVGVAGDVAADAHRGHIETIDASIDQPHGHPGPLPSAFSLTFILKDLDGHQRNVGSNSGDPYTVDGCGNGASAPGAVPIVILEVRVGGDKRTTPRHIQVWCDIRMEAIESGIENGN